jgi:hypothetical protein
MPLFLLGIRQNHKQILLNPLEFDKDSYLLQIKMDTNLKKTNSTLASLVATP